MNIVENSYLKWRDVMDNSSDPRTKDWFLMSSPLPTLTICLSYICIVKIIGPKFMQSRKAYKAQNLQLLYNIVHLVINIVLFYFCGVIAWFNQYSYRCQPIDTANTGVPMKIAQLSWLYYVCKFTDFFETFTYVALKRFDMINLYHVAHHSVMPFSVWWGVKFLPGGHSTFFGFLNTFVHIIIYTYYILKTLIPQSKQYFTWWKSFYPYLQISQFVIIFVHTLQLLLWNECHYPSIFVYFISGHAVLFFVLVTFKMKNDKKILMELQVKQQ